MGNPESRPCCGRQPMRAEKTQMKTGKGIVKIDTSSGFKSSKKKKGGKRKGGKRNNNIDKVDTNGNSDERNGEACQSFDIVVEDPVSKPFKSLVEAKSTDPNTATNPTRDVIVPVNTEIIDFRRKILRGELEVDETANNISDTYICNSLDFDSRTGEVRKPSYMLRTDLKDNEYYP